MQFWVKVKGHIHTNLTRDKPLSHDTSSHQISTKNLHSLRRYRAEGNSGFKVTGSRSKVASTRFFHVTHLYPLIHPSTKYQPKISIRFEDTERKGIIMQFWVKVKGRIDTILSLYTPLYPDTSSHQISTKNFSHLGIIERKGNIMQFGVMVTGSRSKVTSTQIFCLTHLCPLIQPHTKYQPKILICLGDTERKGILVSKSQSQGQRSHRQDSSAQHTVVPSYITHANFTKRTHLCHLIQQLCKFYEKILQR
jgi:hypothetical protein